ncbi:triacylglycerol lipase 2-like [Musa acuminata AAA Group]|uniref:triacylglycerol lipase 2-like n=1 Tax=Musa acuminata AAA Group TaxID=214697 RepID=UPI0031DD76DC
MAIDLLSMRARLLFVSVSATGDQNGSHQYEHLIRQVVASDPPSPANGACKSIMGTYVYKCEEHEVTTKDGYILGVQRIPMGRSPARNGGSGTPILLQHGLFMDGLGWLLSSPDESLGYILADEGYDVWIANSRGTKHSRRNTGTGHGMSLRNTIFLPLLSTFTGIRESRSFTMRGILGEL